MDKQTVIQLISSKIKLIRLERGYSQDKMADVLGISKKTLVQIEKERALTSWTLTIAVSSLFSESDTLQSVLGDEPLEVIKMIAHEESSQTRQKTMGGRVWWEEVDSKGRFLLQKNLVSQHYRIIDEKKYRWFSSFDKEDSLLRLEELYLSE